MSDDYQDGGDLVHCCTLSLCHLGSEMIITDIHISIQRSSSGLLTSSDLNVPLTHDHHGYVDDFDDFRGSTSSRSVSPAVSPKNSGTA